MAQDPRFSLKVLLGSAHGATAYRDPGFQREVKWDVPLLEGYEHRILPNWSPVPNPSTIWGLINPGIIGEVWSGHYDALMLLSWVHPTTWLAIFAALAKGVPIMLKPEATIHRRATGWRARVKRWVLGWLFRHTAAILAPGKHGAEFFYAYGARPDQVSIAPYAVDNDFFFSQAAQVRGRREEVRTRLRVSAGTPLIMFVGKLYPGKRPLDLLQAFAALRREYSAALVFIGDGESRADLEAWVKDNQVPSVHFAGFRNQTELPEFLAAADIFVLPSQLETWGLVINEAMCFGLPVITTDKVGAGGDLVHEGENGFLYPVGDWEALRRHLVTLACSEDLRRRMGARSVEIIRAWSYREDLEAIAAALQQMFPADLPATKLR